jgi:hypothetical protein
VMFFWLRARLTWFHGWQLLVAETMDLECVGLSSELADTWYALDFMMETLLGLIQRGDLIKSKWMVASWWLGRKSAKQWGRRDFRLLRWHSASWSSSHSFSNFQLSTRKVLWAWWITPNVFARQISLWWKD